MKNSIIYFLMISGLLQSCSSSLEDFKICGTRCPKDTPWTYESFNQGQPCFATQDLCIEWARSHGYIKGTCARCEEP